MNFNALERNIIDVIKEEQIKLGYRSEVIRLYYPIQSLNRFLGTEEGQEGMQNALATYYEKEQSVLGQVEISHRGDRFCFMIPETAVDYVHEHTKENEFIREFIRTIEKHTCTIEDLVDVFHKTSEQVHFEKTSHGEFDYLIYFEDGKPDDFRYCITDEGCHMIYHRFTPGDYEEFQFEG